MEHSHTTPVAMGRGGLYPTQFLYKRKLQKFVGIIMCTPLRPLKGNDIVFIVAAVPRQKVMELHEHCQRYAQGCYCHNILHPNENFSQHHPSPHGILPFHHINGFVFCHKHSRNDSCQQRHSKHKCHHKYNFPYTKIILKGNLLPDKFLCNRAKYLYEQECQHEGKHCEQKGLLDISGSNFPFLLSKESAGGHLICPESYLGNGEGDIVEQCKCQKQYSCRQEQHYKIEVNCPLKRETLHTHPIMYLREW